jgi:hypothetical protein
MANAPWADTEDHLQALRRASRCQSENPHVVNGSEGAAANISRVKHWLQGARLSACGAAPSATLN